MSKLNHLEMDRSSHKVIEKRRRDRINNCLVELSQTVPSVFAKQASGKLEKAEILEMTVDYLRALQATEVGVRFENSEWYKGDAWCNLIQYYQLGYNDCMQEVLRFLTDIEGIGLNDSRCIRILSYLQTRFRPESSIKEGIGYRKPILQHNSLPDKKEHSFQANAAERPPPRAFRQYSPAQHNSVFSQELKTRPYSLSVHAAPTVLSSNLRHHPSVLSPRTALPSQSYSVSSQPYTKLNHSY